MRILVIADCCDSGTISRAFGVPAPRVEGARPRFLSPAVIDVLPVNEERAVALEAVKANVPSLAGAALLPGCPDDDCSHDARAGLARYMSGPGQAADMLVRRAPQPSTGSSTASDAVA